MTVSPATPCSGTPAVSTASTTTVCPGTSGTVTLSGLTGAAGYTYLWKQSSSPTYPGTFAAASGTNNGGSYTTPTSLPFTPTYYMCEVTCSNSGLMTPSNAGNVSYNSFLNCYCTPTFSTGSGGGTDAISAVNLVDNSGGALTPTPFNLTGLSATSSPFYLLNSTVFGSLSLATIYQLKVTKGNNANSVANAWIDFNQDGSFNTTSNVSGNPAINGEYLGQSTTGSGQYTFTFVVPSGASTGTTALRIIETRNTGGTNACAANARGEARDYRISITGAACSGTPTAGNVYAGSSGTNTTASVCPSATQAMFVTGQTSGVSGITYQWQSSSTSGGTYTNVSGGSGATTASYTTAALANATTNAITTYYKCLITCTNGNATAIQTTPVAVTVNPTPVLTVNGSNAYTASMCNTTGSVALAVSNAAAGATTYSWSPNSTISPNNTSASVTVTPASTTTYTVTGTAATCVATATAAITVNPGTVTITPASVTIAIGSNTSLTASATSTNGTITNYTWSPTNTLNTSSGATVTANPLSTTVYTVTATDPGGCSRTGTATVNVSSGTV